MRLYSRLTVLGLSFLHTLIPIYSIAAQGGSYGGGGNVVLCEGQPAEVLDYYNAKLPTLADFKNGKTRQLIDLSKMDEEETVKMIYEKLGPFLTFRGQLKNALKRIGPMQNWIAADLKQVDDSAEPYMLPKTCSRATAAFRQNPVNHGIDPVTMYVDPSIEALLSPSQKGILRLHEAFYLISSLPSIWPRHTSTEVRHLMRELLKKESDVQALKRFIGEIGGNSVMNSTIVDVSSGRHKVTHRKWDQETGVWKIINDGLANIVINKIMGTVSIETDSMLKSYTKNLPLLLQFNCSTERVIDEMFGRGTPDEGALCADNNNPAVELPLLMDGNVFKMGYMQVGNGLQYTFTKISD